MIRKNKKGHNGVYEVDKGGKLNVDCMSDIIESMWNFLDVMMILWLC
jgi:hypothetical protein